MITGDLSGLTEYVLHNICTRYIHVLMFYSRQRQLKETGTWIMFMLISMLVRENYPPWHITGCHRSRQPIRGHVRNIVVCWLKFTRSKFSRDWLTISKNWFIPWLDANLFLDDIFKFIFLYEDCSIFIQISLNFSLRSPFIILGI